MKMTMEFDLPRENAEYKAASNAAVLMTALVRFVNGAGVLSRAVSDTMRQREQEVLGRLRERGALADPVVHLISETADDSARAGMSAMRGELVKLLEGLGIKPDDLY